MHTSDASTVWPTLSRQQDSRQATHSRFIVLMPRSQHKAVLCAIYPQRVSSSTHRHSTPQAHQDQAPPLHRCRHVPVLLQPPHQHSLAPAAIHPTAHQQRPVQHTQQKRERQAVRGTKATDSQQVVRLDTQASAFATCLLAPQLWSSSAVFCQDSACHKHVQRMSAHLVLQVQAATLSHLPALHDKQLGQLLKR